MSNQIEYAKNLVLASDNVRGKIHSFQHPFLPLPLATVSKNRRFIMSLDLHIRTGRHVDPQSCNRSVLFTDLPYPSIVFVSKSFSKFSVEVSPDLLPIFRELHASWLSTVVDDAYS